MRKGRLTRGGSFPSFLSTALALATPPCRRPSASALRGQDSAKRRATHLSLDGCGGRVFAKRARVQICKHGAAATSCSAERSSRGFLCRTGSPAGTRGALGPLLRGPHEGKVPLIALGSSHARCGLSRTGSSGLRGVPERPYLDSRHLCFPTRACERRVLWPLQGSRLRDH